MKEFGINFGIDNCAVSIYDDEKGTTRCLPIMGEFIVPSMVWINSKEFIFVGHAAKKHATDAREHAIAPIRDLGSNKTYIINGQNITPTEAATIIFAYLKREVQKILGEEVQDAIISTPVSFGFQELEELRKAAIDAGLNPKVILPEPTAFALFFSHYTSIKEANVCLVNLKETVCDVTVFNIKGNGAMASKKEIAILGNNGSSCLGSNDCYSMIFDWMTENDCNVSSEFEKEMLKNSLISSIDLITLPNGLTLTKKEQDKLIHSKLVQISEMIHRTISQSTTVDGKSLTMDSITRFIFPGDFFLSPVVCNYFITTIGSWHRYGFGGDVCTDAAEGCALYGKFYD